MPTSRTNSIASTASLGGTVAMMWCATAATGFGMLIAFTVAIAIGACEDPAL